MSSISYAGNAAIAASSFPSNIHQDMVDIGMPIAPELIRQPSKSMSEYAVGLADSHRDIFNPHLWSGADKDYQQGQKIYWDTILRWAAQNPQILPEFFWYWMQTNKPWIFDLFKMEEREETHFIQKTIEYPTTIPGPEARRMPAREFYCTVLYNAYQSVMIAQGIEMDLEYFKTPDGKREYNYKCLALMSNLWTFMEFSGISTLVTVPRYYWKPEQWLVTGGRLLLNVKEALKYKAFHYNRCNKSTYGFYEILYSLFKMFGASRAGTSPKTLGNIIMSNWDFFYIMAMNELMIRPDKSGEEALVRQNQVEMPDIINNVKLYRVPFIKTTTNDPIGGKIFTSQLQTGSAIHYDLGHQKYPASEFRFWMRSREFTSMFSNGYDTHDFLDGLEHDPHYNRMLDISSKKRQSLASRSIRGTFHNGMHASAAVLARPRVASTDWEATWSAFFREPGQLDMDELDYLAENALRDMHDPKNIFSICRTRREMNQTFLDCHLRYVFDDRRNVPDHTARMFARPAADYHPITHFGLIPEEKADQNVMRFCSQTFYHSMLRGVSVEDSTDFNAFLSGLVSTYKKDGLAFIKGFAETLKAPASAVNLAQRRVTWCKIFDNIVESTFMNIILLLAKGAREIIVNLLSSSLMEATISAIPNYANAPPNAVPPAVKNAILLKTVMDAEVYFPNLIEFALVFFPDLLTKFEFGGVSYLDATTITQSGTQSVTIREIQHPFLTAQTLTFGLGVLTYSQEMLEKHRITGVKSLPAATARETLVANVESVRVAMDKTKEWLRTNIRDLYPYRSLLHLFESPLFLKSESYNFSVRAQSMPPMDVYFHKSTSQAIMEGAALRLYTMQLMCMQAYRKFKTRNIDIALSMTMARPFEETESSSWACNSPGQLGFCYWNGWRPRLMKDTATEHLTMMVSGSHAFVPTDRSKTIIYPYAVAGRHHGGMGHLHVNHDCDLKKTEGQTSMLAALQVGDVRVFQNKCIFTILQDANTGVGPHKDLEPFDLRGSWYPENFDTLLPSNCDSFNNNQPVFNYPGAAFMMNYYNFKPTRVRSGKPLSEISHVEATELQSNNYICVPALSRKRTRNGIEYTTSQHIAGDTRPGLYTRLQSMDMNTDNKSYAYNHKNNGIMV